MKATKLISLLLVVAMLMSLLVVGVNAATISIGEVDYKAQTGYQTSGESRLPLVSASAVTMTAYAAGTESEYVTISTVDEMMKFAELVNNGDTFEGRKVYLIDEIDMTGKTWDPIGNNTVYGTDRDPGLPYFKGYFDGRGNTIKNLVASSNAGKGTEIVYVSLFGYVRGAVICNLVIDSSCSFTYEGESTNARTGAVGFVMSMGGDPIGSYSTDKVTVLIENVQNNAAVKGGTGYAGGIVALGWARTSYAPIIQCCESNGGVSGRVAAGVLGYYGGGSRSIRIWGCKVQGKIQGSEMQAPFYNKESNCSVDPFAGDNKNDSTGVNMPFLINQETGVHGYQANFAGYRPIQVTDDLVSMTDYANGTISKSNTYTISTADQLVAFSNLVNNTTKMETFVGKYVYLMNDIDMSAVTNWTPIGNNVSVGATNFNGGEVTCFRGYFDGQHHSIKNLKLTSEAIGNANVGLFGFVRGAVICNLVIDASCSFTYTGESTNARTGVIAFVASMGADGGLFGDYLGKSSDSDNVSVLIENVKSNAVVNGGTGFAGGIVAMAAGFTSYRPIIQTCESAGAVSGRVAGGILGAMSGNNNTRWIRLFANKTSGTVCGTEYAGAIYNKIPNMGGVEANGMNHALYANVITTGYDLYLTGYSKDNVSAVDLANVPHINDYTSGPALKLTEAADLQTLADKVAAGNTFTNVTIYLANDLDCSALTDFKGIGSSAGTRESSIYFQGIFDGQGYTISNLTITGSGLFNAISSDASNVVIRNVYMEASCAVNVSGDAHVGGLVGYAFIAGGTSGISIYNCYVAATLNGAESRYTAGFVGYLFDGTTDAMALKIRNCTFAGEATAVGGSATAAGFVGEATRPTCIEHCLVTGSLNGTAGAAYVIIRNDNVTSILKNNVNASGEDLPVYLYNTPTKNQQNEIGYDYTAVEKLGTAELDKIPHISQYNHSNPAKAYKITDPADLQILADNVDKTYTFANITIYLANDLDCSSLQGFKGIGDKAVSNKYFEGIFDGQGYVINGLNIQGYGLFNHVRNLNAAPEIRNVVMSDTCSITFSSTNRGQHIGGLVARSVSSAINLNNGLRIENCYMAATISSNCNGFIGGLVGYHEAWGAGNEYVLASLKVRNCTVASKIECTDGSSGLAGFVCAVQDTAFATYIESNLFTGSLVGNGPKGYAIISTTDTVVLRNNLNQSMHAGLLTYPANNTAPQENLANVTETPVIRYAGYQTQKDANGKVTAIRILAVLDDLNIADKVGFRFSNGNESVDFTTSTVYTSIMAVQNGLDSTVRSESVGGKYIVAFTLTDLPAEKITLTVSFLTDTTATDTVTITVNA